MQPLTPTVTPSGEQVFLIIPVSFIIFITVFPQTIQLFMIPAPSFTTG